MDNDDVEAILESAWVAIKNLQAEVRALKTAQQVGTTRDVGPYPANYGLCVPTAPESTSVIVRAGWVWNYAHYNDEIQQVAPMSWRQYTVDLADYAGAFDNAYYYRWAILAMDLHGWPDPDFGLWEPVADIDEFDNPQTAMRDFDSTILNCDINLADLWYDPLAYPLAVLLLRNNGTTGGAGEILPVTFNDRSQSSFMNQDARPWMNLVCTWVC
jgi:hypothetical protein